MSQKLYKWEIALVCGVMIALLWGAGVVREQTELSDRVVRIHVIANSDTPEDQTLKLAVRDAVLDQIAELSTKAKAAEELEKLLAQQLSELEKTGEAVLRANGCPYTVTASLTNCWFPTKGYEGFSFPSGEYRALRLIIGEGEGQNWWCVAFPPLCVGASSQSIEEAVEVGYFTQEQGELLTKAGEKYVLRFKCMELFGTIKGMLLQDRPIKVTR